MSGYVTPYKYRLSIIEKVPNLKEKYTINYRGRELEVDKCDIECADNKKLTRKELLDLFTHNEDNITLNIIGTENFKEDE